MIFKQLIHEVPYYQVEERMVELYPNEEKSLDGYAEVYEILRMTAEEEIEKPMTLHVNYFREEWISEKGYHEFIIGDTDLSWTNEEDEIHVDEGYDVNGTDGTRYGDEGQDPDHYPESCEGNLISYALEFRPWAEWLGYTVCENSLDEIGAVDYVTHCMFELTFNGFCQEQQDGRNAIIQESIDQMNEYKARIKDGEDEDEVMSDLGMEKLNLGDSEKDLDKSEE